MFIVNYKLKCLVHFKNYMELGKLFEMRPRECRQQGNNHGRPSKFYRYNVHTYKCSDKKIKQN